MRLLDAIEFPLEARSERLPETLSAHLVSQDHDRYTEKEHDSWRLVLARTNALVDRRRTFLHPAYVRGLETLALPTRIPTVEDINRRLAPTGWKTVCVDGYVPNSAYVELISRGIFPIARYIRGPEHVDYSPIPDMAHDILGHLPMLFSRTYGVFLRTLAGVMARATPSRLDDALFEANRRMGLLKCDPRARPDAVARAEDAVARVQKELAESPSELSELARMYLWSIEFGVMGDQSSFRIYGAGLLSSSTEVDALCDGKARFEPYSLDVIRHDIAFSDLQDRYFVAEDYDHLLDVLVQYEWKMKAGPRHKDSQVLPAVGTRGDRT